ncbi:F-box/kelch-repeat protein At1g30090 [Linum perenne]
MTLSPKFRLAVIQSSLLNPSPEFELSLQTEPLIPGLPDDVALNCLLRLPVGSHSSCSTVCKRWHLLLGSKDRFFTRRKELDINDPWLFVFAFHKYCQLDLVLKYEIQKNHWTVMNRMNVARLFFGSGVVDGVVYVAGGNSTDLYELDSAEAFDPLKGNWHKIASMGTNMAAYDAAVVDGKLLVTEGWLWPFFVSPRGQVYDPKTGKWENMVVGLREGWTGSSVVVYGRLFVVSELERMKLKVYDTETDSWEAIEGLPLPEKICKPFTVDACDTKIYVVGRNLHVAVGYIARSEKGGIVEGNGNSVWNGMW